MVPAPLNSNASGNSSVSKAKRVLRELVDAMPIVILARAARSALTARREPMARNSLRSFGR